MKEYQAFPISNFRTGFNEAVEPWLLPRDAYQTMINAHLYRGVLEKIEGYSLFAKMTFRNIISLGTPDGVTTTFGGTLPRAPVSTNVFIYGTISVGISAETFTFSSYLTATFVQFTGSNGGLAHIDLTNNNYSVVFGVAPPANTYSSILIAWDSASPGTNAIMGIHPYFSDNGSDQIMVFDTQRVGIIQNNQGTLASNLNCLQVISELPHDFYQHNIFTGAGGTTYTGTLGGGVKVFVPGTVEFFGYNAGVQQFYISDNGFGALSGNNTAGSNAVTGNVNYATGAFTLTFNSAPTGVSFNSAIGIYGNLFSGDFTNFFSLVNYMYFAFFTNGHDQVMYYDGIKIRFLNTNLSVKQPIVGGNPGFPAFDISTCLHVTVNRDRLLLIYPTLSSTNIPQVDIYWSTAGKPLDFTQDNHLPAPTSQPIRTFSFINTDMIVRFANSERVFRYTADAFSPFRWDSTNNLWACDAPYSAINYDTWFSSVGRPAIVGSDGVNVKRADEVIPDFTDPTRLAQQTPAPFMSQNSIGQCYGLRFDDIKEGWLCYNSAPQDQSSTTASDNILSFNYLDQTYATYSFPFSCLGLGKVFNVSTWGTTFEQWQYASNTWGSYEIQNNALIDLAGDQYDSVYQLNDGTTQTIAGDATTTPTPVLMSVITKNFNPFIEQGQLCRFGYLDLFVSAYNTSTLRVQFYLNDELWIDSTNTPQGFFQETMLTFKDTDAMSSAEQTKVWKRIYVGAVGKSFTIRFYQNIADFGTTFEQPIFIHSMVLNMKPAGRIFN